MFNNLNKNKKGFTLIEVVVALGILIIVFSGIISLIITTVNLALTARNKTEAVAFGQKGIAEGVSKTSCDCFSNIPGSDMFPNTPTSTRYYRLVTYDKGIWSGSSFVPDSSGDFVKIISTVQWLDRGNITSPNTASLLTNTGINTYQTTEIIRIKSSE